MWGVLEAHARVAAGGRRGRRAVAPPPGAGSALALPWAAHTRTGLRRGQPARPPARGVGAAAARGASTPPRWPLCARGSDQAPHVLPVKVASPLTRASGPRSRRGGERFVRELADGLIARGHEPRLITSHPGPPTHDGRGRAAESLRLPRPPAGRLPAGAVRGLPRRTCRCRYLALSRGDDDIAHAVYTTDALAAARWARAHRPPVGLLPTWGSRTTRVSWPAASGWRSRVRGHAALRRDRRAEPARPRRLPPLARGRGAGDPAAGRRRRVHARSGRARRPSRRSSAPPTRTSRASACRCWSRRSRASGASAPTRA